MNTDTGQFEQVLQGEFWNDFNKYEHGQIVTLDGDSYRVKSFDTVDVDGAKRGEITLRAMSKADRDRAGIFKAQGNRAERRARASRIKKAQRRDRKINR